MIDYSWVVFIKLYICRASVELRSTLCYGLDLFLSCFEDFIAVATHRSINEAIVREYVISIATVELSYREHKVLSRVDVA